MVKDLFILTIDNQHYYLQFSKTTEVTGATMILFHDNYRMHTVLMLCHK